MPLVYDELRRIAARYISRERPGQTLQATALVNEAFVRLAAERPASFRTARTSSPLPRSRCGRSSCSARGPGNAAKRGGAPAAGHARRRCRRPASAGFAPRPAGSGDRRRSALDEALTRLAAPRPRTGAHRRAALLRRADGRGDRGRRRRLAGDRQAPVGDGAGVAEASARMSPAAVGASQDALSRRARSAGGGAA